MPRTPTFVALLGAAITLSGCIERRIHITSNPPGALVRLNDIEVGRTPVEVDFLYYGVYDVRLEMDGYEPLWTSAKAEAPLHEQPGIDLIAEALPHKFKTDIRWHFTMSPSVVDVDAIIARGRDLRDAVGGAGAPAAPAVGEPIVIEGEIEGAGDDQRTPVRERTIPQPPGGELQSNPTPGPPPF